MKNRLIYASGSLCLMPRGFAEVNGDIFSNFSDILVEIEVKKGRKPVGRYIKEKYID